MQEQSPLVVEGLLVEVAREERATLDARQALRDAGIRYDVATQKFAAVRDAVARVLGRSPYSPDVEWPSEARKQVTASQRGSLRFVHMPAGDAAVAALRAVDDALSLEQINQRVGEGGLHIVPRAVNAALINTPGIVKSDDGRYRYDAEKAKDDDVPF